MSKVRPVKTTDLRELAMVFLKLGTIAFGGPAAHIAMMEHEFVRKRAWLSREEFLDLLGAGLGGWPSCWAVVVLSSRPRLSFQPSPGVT